MNKPENMYEGYKLIFNDEFDADTVDPQVWHYETGYIRNNEPQYYTLARPENCFTENGCLVLRAMREDYTDSKGVTAKYTSASVNTSRSFAFRYGKCEMRAKLPVTECKAIWPAFWTLGTNIKTENWPKCGEIDMLEMYGPDITKYFVTLHWEDPESGEYDSTNKNNSTPTYLKLDKPLGDEWHVYGMDWDEKQIRFYMDDKTVFTKDISTPNMAAFHLPHYILLNLALTQEGDRTPLDNGDKIDYMIDYVRVYRKDG